MLWNYIFKSKNKNIANKVYLQIPSYEELTSEEQEYVNKIKEEYLQFYKTENNYIILDKRIFEEFNKYIELTLNIMLKDHISDSVGSIIDSKKLVYYSHKIKNINETLKYKYIALHKIKKDKAYLIQHMGLHLLGKRKINILKSLDYQINTISDLCSNSEQRILDCSTKAIANYPKNIDENTKKELKKRCIEVDKDYQDLFNSSVDIDDNLPIADKATYKEIIIDNFVYENRDLIDKLKEQLNLIVNSTIKDKTMQQEIIDSLMKIKMYYNIFNKYGRNLINELDFVDLYKIIFNVYTYFPFDNDFKEYYNSLEDMHEKEAYRKIIGYKVEMFNNFESAIFYDKKMPKVAIKSIHQILTMQSKDDIENSDNKEGLQYENIINKYLDLLLSLEYKDGLNIYFEHHKNDEIYVSSMDCKLKFFEYYKLLMGVKKNKHSEIIYDLRVRLKEPETLYFIKLLKSLYEVNFNVFPDGIPMKYFYEIFEKYSFNNNLPLQLSCNNLFLNKNFKCSCPLLIPTNKDFTLYIKDDYVIRKFYEAANDKKDTLERVKILLPTNPISIKLCDKDYYKKHLKYLSCTPDNDAWSFPYTSCVAEDTLANLGKMLVLDEKILDYDQIKIQDYLYNVFLPIKDMFDFDDSWKERIKKYTNTCLIYIWSYFFRNLSIGNSFGVIGNISYKKHIPRGSEYDEDMAYKLSIVALTDSLLEYKSLREENNKVKIKNM